MYLGPKWVFRHAVSCAYKRFWERFVYRAFFVITSELCSENGKVKRASGVCLFCTSGFGVDLSVKLLSLSPPILSMPASSSQSKESTISSSVAFFIYLFFLTGSWSVFDKPCTPFSCVSTSCDSNSILIWWYSRPFWWKKWFKPWSSERPLRLNYII